MKTLKFMLAAATAIGLASASQADSKVSGLELYNQNFNALTTGAFDPAANDGFSIEVADDNDSEIKEENANKYLKVSVGTDPLLRAIDYSSSQAHPVDLSASGVASLDINTKVQFTVTPYSDPVTANASDKLMIYLKEMTNGVGEVTGTNLVVKAAKYTPHNPRTGVPASFDATDVEVNGVSVVPGQWYNLKVKALKDSDNVVYFNIWINDTQLSGVDSLYGDAENYNFPSLLGDTSTTLTYVGFAGEGSVDDLVFTRNDVLTSIDFTLALGTGVASVTYTIAGGEPVTTSAKTSTLVAYPRDLITVSATYEGGYKAAETPVTVEGFDAGGNLNDGFRVAESATACSLTINAESEVTTVSFTLNLTQPGVNSVSFTVDGTTYNVTTATTNLTLNPGTVNYTATFDTANWWTGTANGSFTVAANGSYTVPATRESSSNVPASAAAAGITEGAFASADSAELGKVIDWAVAKGKSTTEVNAMTFENALNYTDDERSYLLYGAKNADQSDMTEADAAEALEIESIEYVNGEWVVTSKAGTTLGNGRVEIWGSATLNGTFAPKAAGNQFFKAVLVK